MIKRKFFLVSVAVFIGMVVFLHTGCSIHSFQFNKGMELFKSGDYDKSIAYFQQALKLHPKKSEIKTMLFRSKLNSFYDHLEKARNHRTNNRKDEAAKEYNIALSLFPDNMRLRDEINSYVNRQKKKKNREFKSNIQPPIKLNVKTGEKINLSLKGIPITKIFKVIGKSFNINFVFDKDFRDFLYSIEIEQIGFFEILNQLCMVANIRYRILDSSSVLLYPDTAMKKRSFDLQGIHVFYLGNTMAEDVKKLIMTVFRDQQIMIQEDLNLNALIIKASRDTLVEIEKFVHKIDKEKSEVELNVEILEVNRNFLKEIGIDYGTTPLTLSAGTVNADESADSQVNQTVNWTGLKNLNFFLTIPSVALNVLQQDSESKLIARPNLRGVDGEEIKFMVGDELPIPQTQWQAIAAGGINNTPVTSYQYKNVGVEIKVTPYVHSNDEVTLKIKFTLNFVVSYVDSFPILGKRELENVIRLKEGETNIIAGFIQDEVRQSLNGLPALSKIPVLGVLFGANEKTVKQTDLIFSITPRIIRKIDRKSLNLEPVWTNLQADDQVQPMSSTPAGDNERQPGMDRSSENAIIISPPRRRIPMNNYAYFTLRLSSRSEISTLSVGGSISGGSVQIEEVSTEFFKGDDVRILKDFKGNSFDLGYSFFNKAVSNTVLAQIKVKFLQKGKYSVNLNGISAYSKDRERIDITASSAEAEVY
jgi:general secretion pathway protein D